MTDKTTDQQPDKARDEEPDSIPVLEPEEVPEFGKPTYMVIGTNFVAQTELGELVLSLSHKTKLIRQMPSGLDLIPTLLYLFQHRPEVEKLVDELDSLDSLVLAEKYFQAFAERQRARLGEARRSSRS